MTTSSAFRSPALAMLAAGMALSCGSPTTPSGPDTIPVDEFRTDGMLFTSSARTTADGRLEVTVRVVNETDSFAETAILGGPCMIRARLYESQAGRLVWSAFDQHNVCPDPLELIQLGGGAERLLDEVFDVSQRGTFFVTATIDTVGELVELNAGEVTLP